MKIRERAIRNMPYETRLKQYQKEKEELFYKIKNLTAEEVSQRHKALADKWRI